VLPIERNASKAIRAAILGKRCFPPQRAVNVEANQIFEPVTRVVVIPKENDPSIWQINRFRYFLSHDPSIRPPQLAASFIFPAASFGAGLF
jgi:hypothetical protein